MTIFKSRWLFSLIAIFTYIAAHSQHELECNPTANLPVTDGEVFVNYGSVTNAVSFNNRNSLTVGQPFIGASVSPERSMQTGFWSRFLLPPQAPKVSISQGDFPDRVSIVWNLDPLSAPASNGFVITRDGAFLMQADQSTNEVLDFNVQAGELYEYGVYGRNQFGAGVAGTSVGFVSPNGTITGSVETFSGNPVPGALVTLAPNFGNSLRFDGQDDFVCISYNERFPTNMITASAWVKIDTLYDGGRAIVDYGSNFKENFWIHTAEVNGNKGIEVGVGDGTDVYTLEHSFTDNPDGWHQVAMVYAGSNLLLYVDGDFVSSRSAEILAVDSRISIGADLAQGSNYSGLIDDIRIYDRPLTSSEILLTKDLAVSKNENGLVSYFKCDEGMGEFIFDISSEKLRGEINGAEFDDDYANITNAGKTDDKGYYSIEAINYSRSEEFTATPSVSFYMNNALEFNRAYDSYVSLTDFDLPDTFAFEIQVKPYDLVTKQSLLSYGVDDFDLFVEDNEYKLTLDGETQVLGPAQKKYERISVNNIDGVLSYYLDGIFVKTINYGVSSFDYSGSKWNLGTNGNADGLYFTGLIDEVAFFKDALTIQEIQLHASPVETNGISVGNGKLWTYFTLDEGSGNEVEDVGPARTGFGVIHDATFSILTFRQKETPHVFRPSERLVIINTSNTAASGVDFVDESTVPISGVVRFEETFCYQDSVEILVDGESYTPAIFTDSLGRFVADFEPGATVELTPKYGSEDKEHIFSPGFYKATRVIRPISSILFANQTKRLVEGQLSGGDGRLPISNVDETVRMKISAQNQCYEEVLELDNVAGDFSFKDLPAVKFDVALTFHSNNIIYDYMQEAGGQMTDMRDVEKDTLDFRYYSAPKVYLEEFPTGYCPNGDSLDYPFIDESTPNNGFKKYKKTIRLFEDYAGGRDWLEDFDLVITNNLNDESPDSVKVRDTSAYEYIFQAGQANIGGDFTKFLQVEGISSRNENDIVVERAIVMGERERESSIVTKAPVMPLLILRDPPGDGSNAVWEEGQTHCTTWSNFNAFSAGGSVEEKLKLGSKQTFGVGKETEIKTTNTFGVKGTVSYASNTQREGNVCLTATKTITTSDNDNVPGDDGDVFYGAAVNFEFRTNDVLYLDLDNCEIKSDSTTISLSLDGFATEYIYSAWQIKNTIIPNLLLVGDSISAFSWERILKYNDDLKLESVLDKNITFDGLTTYSETTESQRDRSKSFEASLEANDEFTYEYGFEVDESGFGAGISVNIGSSDGSMDGESFDTTTTISYTFADDDPNDSYSVDVKKDDVFGTPVYKLRGGESMCPWIPGTLNREEIGLQFDKLTDINVPANEAASFKVRLSNLGQTGRDPLVYIIGIKQGSNTDGALVSMEGESLINPIQVQLQPRETKEFVISIERGPDVNIYNYNNIGIFAASECQYQHALGLGYNLAAYADWEDNHNGEPKPTEADGVIEGIYNVVDLEKFYKQFYLNVEFLEPCSTVDIGFPMPNWVQNPVMGDVLNINLNNYINDDPDLELLRVQYRRTGGDGAWINIADVLKSELASSPVFKNVAWDMAELADGPYEIRALAICTSGLNAGVSKVIQGRKETKPPEVFGFPEPADGILSLGDEISITYSKRINCNKIFAADGIGTNINLNNMALQDMTIGGVLIDADFICKDDKIVVIPNIPKQFYENHVLRVTATDIEDLYGNKAEQKVWEFFSNQSNLYWHGGDVDEVVIEGNELIVTREIRNQSGEITTFNIDDYPYWMQVFPTEGSLEPGQRAIVNFIFPNDLVNGEYSTTIEMETVDGVEPLEVDLRVACPEPEWNLDPAQYTFSMNITSELDVEGELSDDKLDIVGAFVNGVLRGVGRVEYVRSLEKHLAFITIYSNVATGETVTFKIWDASECLLFGNTIETFSYVADGLIGSPLLPQTLHTNGEVERKIYIHQGWNWMSYNIDLSDDAINPALSSMTNPAGGFIKSQTAFSTYSNLTSSWVGNLNNLSHLTMYQLNASASDSLILLGAPIDKSSPLPLIAGWNWIGYLPQYGLPVTTALSSLEPLNGDIIKGQLSFAQYVAGVGWIGNLSFMSSPNGYQIKLSAQDTLIYPDRPSTNIIDDGIEARINPFQFEEKSLMDLDGYAYRSLLNNRWTVDPERYEHSMNAIAIVVNKDQENLLSDGDELGVFYGSEIRGAGTVQYVEALDQFIIFITMYGNEENEVLTLKYYDSSSDEEMDIQEDLVFKINNIIGEVEDPFEFTIGTMTPTADVNIDKRKLSVHPNPSWFYVYINYQSTIDQDVEINILDMTGRVVATLNQRVVSGKNVIEWVPDESISSGLYNVILKAEEGIFRCKTELLRQ